MKITNKTKKKAQMLTEMISDLKQHTSRYLISDIKKKNRIFKIFQVAFIILFSNYCNCKSKKNQNYKIGH